MFAQEEDEEAAEAVEEGDVELLGAKAASTVDLIGIEASPQQKDTGI
jgi:hypothetical protein